MRRGRVAFFVVFGVLVPLGACGTSAIGVDVCNQIESARCTRIGTLAMNGTACSNPDSGVPIDLLAPYAAAGSSPTENVAACIRFYSIACLHGLATTTPPSNTGTDSVQTCLNAINDGSCALVLDPTGEAGGGACQWLVPPPDAGSDVHDGSVSDAPLTDTTVTFDTTPPIVDSGADVEECIQGFTCNPMP